MTHQLQHNLIDNKVKSYILFGLCMLIFSLSACKKAEDTATEAAKTNKSTQINVVKVTTQNLEIFEEAVGTIEGVIDPTVAAEISARVIKVLVHPGQTVKKGETIALLDGSDFGLQRNEAQTEVGRIEVLIANQQKVVGRNQALVDKNFISKNALDDASAQLNALKQQLAGAKSRISTINHSGAKNRVVAPTDGVVEKQLVASGDFVRIGDPIVQIISKKLLRAHLPFPESVAAKLKPGLTIKLTTPTSSKEVISVINELKPQVMADSRAIDVIADIRDEADWQPGASVVGRVILGGRNAAIVVPEQSLVLRPAGEVVYVIVGDTAKQKIVKSGLAHNGGIEILEGLNGGEMVAVDGAAFLTDNAKVSILQSNTN